MVSLKKMKNHENILDNHENRQKMVKIHDVEKHRQRWFGPNNCISRDGTEMEHETSPLHRHKKLTIVPV